MTSATRNGTFPHDARAAAEVYLSKGLAPIALPSRSKGEGLPKGWQDQRLAFDDLDSHFPRSQRLNVGVLNGQPSNGLADVDLDCPQALLAAPVLLPVTGWVFGRPSAPRSHLVYRTDPILDKSSEEFHDLNGQMLVELRGTGGLTVFPPSLHKESGEEIAWAGFTAPTVLPLEDLRRCVHEVAAVALLARHWPAKGSRQSAFLALVGGLLRAGWQQDRAERFVEALTATNNDDEARKRVQVVAQTAAKLDRNQNVTGWPKLERLLGQSGKEVVRQVRQWLGMIPVPATSSTTPAKKPVRRLDPYQPFPVEALPAPVGEYVRQGALALGCDPAYLALPALAVVASVIGNTRTIKLKGGWHEPSVVWSAIVGDSGTLKSPAYFKAVSYLFRLQKRLLKEFREQAAKYQQEMQEYQAAKKKAKDEGTDPGDSPEKPVLHRVVCSDTTIEKLAEILEDNPRGTLAARDELAGWLGSFTRYKSQKGATDLPNWLEMHRANTVIVDRKTGDRPHLFIERAAVSVTGGIQPGVLARTRTAEFLESGLAARLLMAMPPKLPKKWTDAEVAPEVERAYRDALDALLALALDTKDDEKVPHVLALSKDGKAAWVAFYDDWAIEQAAVEGEIAAAYSKIEAYAARFALVHHVVERVARGDDDLVPIERESVEAGVTLCRWFAAEARRVYAILSESEEERDDRKLVEFIRARGGQITTRGLMRANCRRYRDAEAAEAALAGLVEAGLARWIEPETAMKGGNAIKAIELCMTHDSDDTDTDDPDDTDPGAHDGGNDTGPGDGPPPPPVSPADPARDQMAPAPSSGVIAVMRHAETSDEPASASGSGRGHADPLENGEAVMRSPCSNTAVPGPAYLLVNNPAALSMVADAIDGSSLIGLDLETTGLNSRSDRVRLLSLACDTIDGGTFCYLVDCFAIDPAPLWEALAGKELIGHNLTFDLGFLERMGFVPSGKIHDLMHLSRILHAGEGHQVKHSLAAVAERHLGHSLDKSEQKSDWSGVLTASQLAYAARDVSILPPLLDAMRPKLKAAGLERVAEIESRCVPAVAWMANRGVAVDRGAWEALVRQAEQEAATLTREMAVLAPVTPGEMFAAWNWGSALDMKKLFQTLGFDIENTDDGTLAGIGHPLAGLLRKYREATKLTSTYGAEWLRWVREDGRVYASWKQTGTVSGRMSCGEPNLQQIPRDKAYRRCFAAPPGRVLVKADYSQLELRIAARVSGDRAMIDAYLEGIDIHTQTAQKVLGKVEVTKEDRQIAKALNFGLLYGMGAPRFRDQAKAEYGIKLTLEQAEKYREAFFATYRGLRSWQRSQPDGSVTTRTLAGRLRADVNRFTEKLNTPVQGTGGDGVKLALALLWERREQVPGAFPVMAIHDEIVVECDADQSEAAAAWVRQAMVDAMAEFLDPVPVEVEVKVGRTWGEG